MCMFIYTGHFCFSFILSEQNKQFCKLCSVQNEQLYIWTFHCNAESVFSVSVSNQIDPGNSCSGILTILSLLESSFHFFSFFGQ